MGSSLPNHDAKGWKGKKKTETKERKQRKLRANCIREGQKKKIQKTTIYMMHDMNAHMMHALMH